jgi:type I restriction enzyme M protein
MRAVSEAETVIKRILPYLARRGYDIEKDLSFEDPVGMTATAKSGFIDITVHCQRTSPIFLIEAKRDGTKITVKHREQALEYGKGIGVLLVAVTNGKSFELHNATTRKPLFLNGAAMDRIPSRKDLLSEVLKQLKRDPAIDRITISADRSLPYRPGLPLSKLNHLIKQCHNSIRKIEKNEEHAFADFSKFMFLKLLEEKWDQEQEVPPYSFTFHELAATPSGKGDRVRAAIKSMIGTIQSITRYGDVLADPIRLTKDASYQSIVRLIASVSFTDCDLDSKGAAFEYFVRATLKGKKLGQYFTPRPLVKLMLHLGRWEQIVNSLSTGGDFKVLDPACGTSGFLVLAMNHCLDEIDRRLEAKTIHKNTATALKKRVREDVFYGIDAHNGVACSAKMNMIVAGDGSNNIRCADSLNEPHLIPPYKRHADGKECPDGKAHLILTNPPFGTSEAESLTPASAATFAIRSARGQSLFIQKMIQSAHDDSLIVTVIDEGVLNTASYQSLRELVLKSCRIEMVLQLPGTTFKPNKIDVRSSVLVLRKRAESDEDVADDYPVTFAAIDSMGYEGSGDEVRGFDLHRLIAEIKSIDASKLTEAQVTTGYHWEAFRTNSQTIATDKTRRLDVRYWHPSVRLPIMQLRGLKGTVSVKELNKIPTRRGKSPPSAEYVTPQEGHALVVKAGSNISKTGELIIGGDYVERQVYEEYAIAGLNLEDGDVLLASTGEYVLGKCCVFRNQIGDGATPGIADGHVAVIRVDQTKVYPEYLCDYLRRGFGHDQIARILTGSTGLIEITPDDVDGVLVPKLPSLAKQKALSDSLRHGERVAAEVIAKAAEKLRADEQLFRNTTMPPEFKLLGYRVIGGD